MTNGTNALPPGSSTGDPEALLNASIFFDFRPLYGDVTLADKLRSWLAAYAAEHNRFLLLMAQNALQNQPPLGVLRDFILTGGGDDYPHTLDLKVNGITPFVDAARIYALAAGVTATNTLERLQEAGARLRFASADVDAWAQAFQYIQNLRLRHQALRLAAGQTPNNHLDPDSLNELDRRILKEALRQARNLQGRLGRDFGGAGVGFGA
ncbi:MAG: putative nucleotidyltransferase substrate binding domain-containing protein [Gammaproteobacteria bacterium]